MCRRLGRRTVCLGFLVVSCGLAIEAARSGMSSESLAWNAQPESQEQKAAERATIQKKDDEPALKNFMRQKLAASNQILEGLCTDDLTMVEAGADVLLKMGREEKWRASNDMLYRRYSREFTDAVTDMKEKSKANSIDGTSLAWINATMKCLKCHEWVRNTILADNSQ